MAMLPPPSPGPVRLQQEAGTHIIQGRLDMNSLEPPRSPMPNANFRLQAGGAFQPSPMAARMLATPPRFSLPSVSGDELVYTTDQSSVLRSPVMPHFGMEGGPSMTSPSPALSPLNSTSFSSFVTAPEVDVSIYNGISHLAGIDGGSNVEDGDSGDTRGQLASHVGGPVQRSGSAAVGHRNAARAAVSLRRSRLSVPASAQRQVDPSSSPPPTHQQAIQHEETPAAPTSPEQSSRNTSVEDGDEAERRSPSSTVVRPESCDGASSRMASDSSDSSVSSWSSSTMDGESSMDGMQSGIKPKQGSTPVVRVQYRGNASTPREVFTFGPTALTGDWTRVPSSAQRAGGSHHPMSASKRTAVKRDAAPWGDTRSGRKEMAADGQLSTDDRKSAGVDANGYGGDEQSPTHLSLSKQDYKEGGGQPTRRLTFKPPGSADRAQGRNSPAYGNGSLPTKVTKTITKKKQMLKLGSSPSGGGGGGSSKKGGEDKKGCNCSRSKCLKLYCECFKANEMCSPDCACNDCHNNLEHQDALNEVKQKLLEKNPRAFDRWSAQAGALGSGLTLSEKEKQKFGCSCAKSACRKNYCECYKDGGACHDWCKCSNCHNPHGIRVSSPSAKENGGGGSSMLMADDTMDDDSFLGVASSAGRAASPSIQMPLQKQKAKKTSKKAKLAMNHGVRPGAPGLGGGSSKKTKRSAAGGGGGGFTTLGSIDASLFPESGAIMASDGSSPFASHGSSLEGMDDDDHKITGLTFGSGADGSDLLPGPSPRTADAARVLAGVV